MKRFSFQLQTALEWRRRRMEQEQLRLQKMESQHAALQADVEQAECTYAAARQETIESPTLMAGDLAALAEFSDAVNLHKQRIGREITRLEAEIKQQRTVVVEATRQCRLLEKLRDRRIAEWHKACDRELETQAGELYLAKWNRGL